MHSDEQAQILYRFKYRLYLTRLCPSVHLPLHTLGISYFPCQEDSRLNPQKELTVINIIQNTAWFLRLARGIAAS